VEHLLKDVAMSGIPDNENAPPYRKFGATDPAVSAAKSDKARENRWNAVLFLILLVWIALLALLGYSIGWLYYFFR
jgi:hypothetical protein